MPDEALLEVTMKQREKGKGREDVVLGFLLPCPYFF